jgi:hypothetical protein
MRAARHALLGFTTARPEASAGRRAARPGIDTGGAIGRSRGRARITGWSSRRVDTARRPHRRDTEHLGCAPGDRAAERKVVRRQDPNPGKGQSSKPQRAKERSGAANSREATCAHAARVGENRRDRRAGSGSADVDHANPGAGYLLDARVEIMLNRATHPLCKTRQRSQSQAQIDYGSEAEVNQYCGAGSYGTSFCTYPWYAFNTTDNAFTYGGDYPGTSKDYGQALQFQQQENCVSPAGPYPQYCSTVLR